MNKVVVSSFLFALIGSACAKTIDVIVGGPGKLLYDPEYVDADEGDTIRFNFQQKNHTATQSSFDYPCQALGDTGFNSGFMPVADDVTSYFPTFDVLVNDTKPIWVYCQQVTHCVQGMVFAANAPKSGNTFDAFKAKAIASGTATSSSATSYSASSSAEPTVIPVTKTVTANDQVWTTTYGSYPGSSEPTWGVKPVDYKVVVGGDAGLIYTPNTVKANIGDTITFEFRQKNHTVTQSSFGDPCRKLEFTSNTGQIGFDSGFQPVGADVTTGFPTWTITVNDTAPIWAYCRQVGHCGMGMVFAANAPAAGNTFDAFKANAIRINGTAATGTGSTSAPTSTQSTNGAFPLSLSSVYGLLASVMLGGVLFI